MHGKTTGKLASNHTNISDGDEGYSSNPGKDYQKSTPSVQDSRLRTSKEDQGTEIESSTEVKDGKTCSSRTEDEAEKAGDNEVCDQDIADSDEPVYKPARDSTPKGYVSDEGKEPISDNASSRYCNLLEENERSI